MIDTRERLETIIEQAIDAGLDVSPQIELLDKIDGDSDLEQTEDEGDFDIEGEYLHLAHWQSYSWNAPKECLYCGDVHICGVNNDNPN